MRHEIGSFAGLGGLRIFTQRWLPDGPPRAVIVLAHGIAEHSGRYAHVARFLVERDYAVCALDYRGHGQSDGPRTTVDAFEDYVTDLHTYVEQVRPDFPDLPLFLYGHSMGSLIALMFAGRYQDDLAGLITTGTATDLVGTSRVTVPLLLGLARALPNARLVPFRAGNISRDPAVIAAYVNDPLVDRRWVPLGMVAKLVRAGIAGKRIVRGLHVPYLVLHGGKDPVCLPRAARTIRATCSSPDLTVKIYDGLRHEIHNEPEQAQVLADIADWLDAHVPA